MYEDDGDSLDYKHGAFRLVRLNHTTMDGLTTLMVQPRAEGMGYTCERDIHVIQRSQVVTLAREPAQNKITFMTAGFSLLRCREWQPAATTL